MYNATKWLDKVVDVDSGEVIQAGTDQSAAHFNNMESGITDASVAAAMLLIAAGELQSQTEIERHVVELKNTASYPFNNSAKTVSLAITRDNTDYTVDADIQAHTGNVGEIQIYDKQLNGFKVKYDGSATVSASTTTHSASRLPSIRATRPAPSTCAWIAAVISCSAPSPAAAMWPRSRSRPQPIPRHRSNRRKAPTSPAIPTARP